MLPEEEKSPVSPPRFPFPWHKNVEDSVNPKVTSRLQAERSLEADPFTDSPTFISPQPQGGPRCCCESQFTRQDVCLCSDDAHIAQSLAGHGDPPPHSRSQLQLFELTRNPSELSYIPLYCLQAPPLQPGAGALPVYS